MYSFSGELGIKRAMSDRISFRIKHLPNQSDPGLIDSRVNPGIIAP